MHVGARNWVEERGEKRKKGRIRVVCRVDFFFPFSPFFF